MRIENLIVIDWLVFKPYDTPNNVDLYYFKLAKKMKSIIKPNYEAGFLSLDIEGHLNAFCCFLTCYFEDKISRTNIYNTFVKLHTQLYERHLPFFDIEDEEYFVEDIYQEDIQVLIWYFLNLLSEDWYVSPRSKIINTLAKEVYALFDEAFEEAPENERLKEIFTFKPLQQMQPENAYYDFRDQLYIFYFENYLLYPDIGIYLYKCQKEIVINLKNKDSDQLIMPLPQMINYVINEFNIRCVHNHRTKLLNLNSAEWFAAFLGEDHSFYETISKVKNWVTGDFLYKGHDEQYIFLDHIATDHRINLSRVSYEPISNFKEVDNIATLGMIQWNDEWWFSGNARISEFDADLILDCKNSTEERMAFAEIIESEVDNEFNDIFRKAFKRFNKGSDLAFLPVNEVNDFLQDFMAFHNDLRAEATEEKLEDSLKRARSKGYFGGDKKVELDLNDSIDAALIYASPSSGLEINTHACGAFPLKENPYYNEVDLEDSVKRLIQSQAASKELTLYCLENFGDQFTFLDNEENRYLKDNLDFVMRFCKGEKYYPKRTVATV